MSESSLPFADFSVSGFFNYMYLEKTITGPETDVQMVSAISFDLCRWRQLILIGKCFTIIQRCYQPIPCGKYNTPDSGISC